MGIEVATPKGKSEITEKNFSESIKTLEDILEPGTPVMLQNYDSSSLRRHSQRHKTTRWFFFSGGRINNSGHFNLQKGKRNFSCVRMSNDYINRYQIMHLRNKMSDTLEISSPKGWRTRQYNEGTFSPAGPQEWYSNHSSGTEKVVVGDTLEEQFPITMNALKFARDAFYFNLHPFYSNPNYLVTEMRDKGIRVERERQPSEQTNRITCLRACINLITEAEKELEVYREPVKARHLGCFRDRPAHPVEDTDYIIEELAYPGKKIAFVKTGKGSLGETYILPFSDKNNEILELAFSEDMIKKHYPYGFDK